MNTLNKHKAEHIMTARGRVLMDTIDEVNTNVKPETEDLNYYFKIWLKKGRDHSKR